MSIGDSALTGIGSIPAYAGAASAAQAAAVIQTGAPAGDSPVPSAGALPAPGALPAAVTEAEETSALTGQLLSATTAGPTPAAVAPSSETNLISSGRLLAALQAIPSQNAAQALALLNVGVPGAPSVAAPAAGNATAPARNPITDTF